jgi:hypothetical protein
MSITTRGYVMQTNFFGMFVLLKQVEFMMEDIRDF